MSLIDLTNIIEKAGPVAALIIFFIWRDYKRELSLTGRLQHYEDFLRQELVNIIKTTTDAILENTASRHAVVEVLKELPCKSCIELRIGERG